MDYEKMSYEDEWKYVRDRIKELRTAKGLSIQALADIADMERVNLGRIERGVATNITFLTLCKIAEALEVAPGELVRR
jgi:transcriptional regulator with XRE-family HTH domain